MNNPKWYATPIWGIRGAFAFVIIFWLYCGGLSAATGTEANKFDALSALFTGLAFVGLLWTLHYQKKEMDDTRKVLAETAEANKKAADAGERTALNALKQAKVQLLVTKYQILDPKFQKSNKLWTDAIGRAPENQQTWYKESQQKLKSQMDAIEHQIDLLTQEVAPPTERPKED